MSKLIQLKKSNHLLYQELYGLIIKTKGYDNPIVKLFCEFLEENYIVYNNKIPKDAFILLLVKGLALKHAHGFDRKQSATNIKTIPEIWETLINNMSLIGDRFYNEFSSFFNNRLIIDFGFEPYFSLTKLARDMNSFQKDNDDEEPLNRNIKVGGSFHIVNRGKIKQKEPNDWLYMDFGYWFYLDVKEKCLSMSIYARIEGNGLVPVECSDELETTNREEMLDLHDENSLYYDFLTLILKSINETFTDNLKMKSSFKRSLSSLQKKIADKVG